MISILGVPIVAVIIFLNSFIGGFIVKRWLPLSAIALGIAITILFKWDVSAMIVLEGIIYGGMAMGVFDLGKKTILNKKSSDEG